MACILVSGNTKEEAQEYVEGIPEAYIGEDYDESQVALLDYAACVKDWPSVTWKAENNNLVGQKAYFVMFAKISQDNKFADIWLAYEVPQE